MTHEEGKRDRIIDCGAFVLLLVCLFVLIVLRRMIEEGRKTGW